MIFINFEELFTIVFFKQKMRGMVEGRGERSDCSKRNCIMKEKISELLAITGGKAQEKIEKTHTSDAVS